jgi:drug/metabolite transporter (DMT)-like permease
VVTAAPLSDNLRGSLLMVAAMAGFAVEDLFLKSAARSLPVGQVILTMGLGGVIVFALMARRAGEPAFPAAFLSRAMLIRSGFEVAGRLFYSLSLALTTLSATSAILQATPLVVVAGAALLFGERVGWRRWAAILLGFAGVLVILRPGLEGFTPLSLLAVAGMIGFAGRDLATRAAPPGLSNRQLGVLGFAMLGLAGAVILMLDKGPAHWPDGHAWLMLAGCTGFGIAAYHALTRAMRTGEVSVVTPFRYTRLVFALILAVAFLGERPDLATLAGSALIVAAGVYTLLRARG